MAHPRLALVECDEITALKAQLFRVALTSLVLADRDGMTPTARAVPNPGIPGGSQIAVTDLGPK